MQKASEIIELRHGYDGAGGAGCEGFALNLPSQRHSCNPSKC